MGRENRYFKVGGLRFLQALTPQERYSRFIVASPSGPLSRGGKGGGGKGQMRLRLPWERFCAQYGLISGSRRKSIRIQHSQRQGSWGSAPSVFWYRAPGGTRGPLGKGGAAERWRVAYPIGIAARHGAQPATTRTHKRNASAASGANYAFAKGSAPPTGEMILWHDLCHQSSGSLRSPPPFTQGRLWDGALPLHREACGLG